MAKEKYHHGDLKKELIQKGLQLLNKEGYEGFSLRKVATMCGVSHAAPYKHFKSKEELIQAITAEVSGSFTDIIVGVSKCFSDDYRLRLLEAGKQYVKFMVENPDYFRFIFLTDHNNPIVIKDGEFILRENHPFKIVVGMVTDYLASANLHSKDIAVRILSIWSMIHGLTVLLVNRTIEYSGDYEELVLKILEEI